MNETPVRMPMINNCGLLIRYKDKIANLDNLFDIYCYDNESTMEDTSAYYITFEYMLVHPDGDTLIDKNWHFNTEKERDEAFNYILNTYFTDIEIEIRDDLLKLMNKENN